MVYVTYIIFYSVQWVSFEKFVMVYLVLTYNIDWAQ